MPKHTNGQMRCVWDATAPWMCLHSPLSPMCVGAWLMRPSRPRSGTSPPPPAACRPPSSWCARGSAAAAGAGASAPLPPRAAWGLGGWGWGWGDRLRQQDGRVHWVRRYLKVRSQRKMPSQFNSRRQGVCVARTHLPTCFSAPPSTISCQTNRRPPSLCINTYTHTVHQGGLLCLCCYSLTRRRGRMRRAGDDLVRRSAGAWPPLTRRRRLGFLAQQPAPHAPDRPDGIVVVSVCLSIGMPVPHHMNLGQAAALRNGAHRRVGVVCTAVGWTALDRERSWRLWRGRGKAKAHSFFLPSPVSNSPDGNLLLGVLLSMLLRAHTHKTHTQPCQSPPFCHACPLTRVLR